MQPIPLFGAGLEGYSKIASVQRRLNCFYDVRLDGDKHATVLRCTPGAFVEFSLPTAPIRGWHVAGSTTATGTWIAVAGAVWYRINYALGTTPQIDGDYDSYTYTVIGTLLTNTGLVEMQDNGNQLIIVDGAYGYIYTLVSGTYYQTELNAAGSFGLIADPNFPFGATTVDFINGRFLANKPGTRQAFMSCQDSNGNAYDGTRWTDETYSIPLWITKENSSDVLLAVDVLNGTIVLWGAQTIEFFQDVGTSPNPFQRINGATQSWGLAAVFSRAELNSTIYFLGQPKVGGMQVMALQGYTPVRISTSDLENQISGFPIWTDATSLAYLVDGHPMYQINFPAADKSFMYDTSTQFWSDRQTGVGVTGRHFANLGIAFNTEYYVADSTTGNISELDIELHMENDEAVKREVVSRHIHANGNEVGIAELWLDIETGVGNETDPAIEPQICLQVSKDNGRTFGVEKWRSLGRQGRYKRRVFWDRLGSARDFVFKLTLTDPVKFTVVRGSADITQSEGAVASA